MRVRYAIKELAEEYSFILKNANIYKNYTVLNTIFVAIQLQYFLD